MIIHGVMNKIPTTVTVPFEIPTVGGKPHSVVLLRRLSAIINHIECDNPC